MKELTGISNTYYSKPGRGTEKSAVAPPFLSQPTLKIKHNQEFNTETP